VGNLDIPRDLLLGWDVVVIDDEEDSLMVAEIILREYGANLYTASDGAQGLDIVRQVRPRFVISDVSMPVMDGWGFIHALRNDPELSYIPAIALTAHAMIGDRERAVEAGFHNYLSKPLTPETFIIDLLDLLMDIPSLAESLNI